MDDDTARMLARYQHRMANAERLYRLADGKREAAAEIERQVALPDHERPVGDETTQRLEARLLRQEADELTREANGIQQRLHGRDSPAQLGELNLRRQRPPDRER